jgi:hypothetical protein
VSFATCVDIGGSNAGTVAGVMNFFGQIGGFLLSISFGKIADLSNNFTAPCSCSCRCVTHRFFAMVICGPKKTSDPARHEKTNTPSTKYYMKLIFLLLSALIPILSYSQIDSAFILRLKALDTANILITDTVSVPNDTFTQKIKQLLGEKKGIM